MPPLEFHPCTPDRWEDVERLFGPRGACGGCWCMWWRLKRSEFQGGKGERNRRALKALVLSGNPPGILAYSEGRPVGWCALAPRDDYTALDRSRILKRVDDRPVWSVTCFFIDRSWRRKGVASGLVKAAVRYARRRGAEIVEAYPVEPRGSAVPDVFAYTGVPEIFRRAGFTEVARRSATRPIVRSVLAEGAASAPAGPRNSLCAPEP